MGGIRIIVKKNGLFSVSVEVDGEFEVIGLDCKTFEQAITIARNWYNKIEEMKRKQDEKENK